MAQTVSVIVGTEDRARLAAVVGDRSRPLKHIQRARIVLLSAERLPVLAVARGAGVSRPAVWRWQRRYAEEGVEGLLRDKTRPPGKPPLPAATVARVLALTCAEPPGEATHWTGRAMAKTVGISLRAVQRIWEAHRLQPHRWRTFKRSNDPAFAEKVEDVVGLYMHPPAHSIVLSIDEKSQIQALDRTQPGLPLKPGKCGTMTHDYKRRTIPPGKIIHAIADNYATHKHPKVRAWLARHPRWVLHFTPTSASWLNAVETFFSVLSRRRLKRGIFTSIADLQAAINRYIEDHNDDPKPFVWTKPADTILAKIDRLPVPSV
ncbi:MAG: IS630 family transposase [Candidatus Tectomicrobia bacterium]|uniref:IS630 family transposase n=1 Tax=Tectimicrobiota bacterium TaxID=2528274 RepID=A0A932GNT7_UNCTE|nr:IS630 family transposase [Candidatus Tectomicrobia bacterium]